MTGWEDEDPEATLAIIEITAIACVICLIGLWLVDIIKALLG